MVDKEPDISPLTDAFDLLTCVERIVRHKHVENLKALRNVIDNRIKELLIEG